MLKYLVFAYLIIFNTLQTFAWGPNGHRIVGEIADMHLKRKAKKQIRAILGNESIAITSNWADFIKSDTSYNYLGPWHYVNVKKGMNFKEFDQFLRKVNEANAFNKLNFLVNELKNKNLASDKKQLYLRLLIHIAGDVHQPMHVSRAEDQGGNRIKVLWFNEPSNLHAVWDDKLIEYQKLSYTEYVKNINFTDKNQRKLLQSQPIAEWLYESYQISDKLYQGITQPDQKLSYRYNFDHIATLNEQLLKGGIRLAGLLNEIFG
jgi:S1/P1 Nuclease